MKVGHYIPAYNEQVHTGVMRQACREAVGAYSSGVDMARWTQHSCDLIANRNQAMNKALMSGLDFLFMQDADVYSEAPSGVIGQLIKVALDTKATLVGAPVWCRTDPPRMNIAPWDESACPGQVFEVEKMGSGMILIDLARVREWYDEYQGPCFQRVYEDDRAITPQVGSDIYFCKVVRAHGGRIVCDARIPTVHINGVHRLAFDGEKVTDMAASMDTDPAVFTGVATGA